ncbi:MAG: DNA polymerase sliding clamp [Acidilobaceae archaeon]
MRFHLAYSKASKFKYVTLALSKISDECNLSVTEDGVTFWMMSPDKTIMAVVSIPPLSLDAFEVDEPVRLVVRTEDLHRVAKRAGRNDVLELELPEGETGFVSSRLVDKKTGMQRSFEIPVLSTSGAEYREPRISTTARFTMNSKDFKLLSQDVKVVGDTLAVRAVSGEVRVTARGENKLYEWVLKPGDPLIDLDVEEPSESLYSRSSIDIAVKPAGAAETVRFEFATNYPARLTFNLPGGEKMMILVAPIVE